ncbi:MAG TPA: hypothetical protein VF292_08300 [Rhodanobacteraceae bacterium]
MSARRSPLDRQWGWPTIGRQAPLLITFALIGAVAGVTLSHLQPGRPGWSCAVGGVALAFGSYIVWRVVRLCAWLWRRRYHGWVREVPGCAKDAIVAGTLAYLFVKIAAMATHRADVIPVEVALGTGWLIVTVRSHCRAARRTREQ